MYRLRLCFLLTLAFSLCQAQFPSVKDMVILDAVLDSNEELANCSELKSAQAPNRITRTIIQDDNNKIWFATFGGLITFDGANFTKMSADLSNSNFFSAIQDKSGKLWFGTIGDGLFCYDGSSFKNYTTKDGLVDDRVSNLFEDSNGDLWIGTLGGASCYDGQRFTSFTAKDGLPNSDVNTVVSDKDGLLWFGTRGTACTFDGNTFKEIEHNGKPFTNVRHLLRDASDNIWIAGNNGLWYYDHKTYTQISDNFTGYMFIDKQSNLWTSSEEAKTRKWVLTKYEFPLFNIDKRVVTKVKESEAMLFGILEDSNGNIWFGDINGVNRYDGSSFCDFKE